jgi:hypothetical protein
MDAMVLRVEAAAADVSIKGALAIQREGMSRTRVVTGTNRRSWHSEGPLPVELGFSSKTGPGMVYSRRLELGFVGADSLGRVYNQHENPYVKPAVDAMRPVILADAVKQYAAAIRG